MPKGPEAFDNNDWEKIEATSDFQDMYKSIALTILAEALHPGIALQDEDGQLSKEYEEMVKKFRNTSIEEILEELRTRGILDEPKLREEARKRWEALPLYEAMMEVVQRRKQEGGFPPGMSREEKIELLMSEVREAHRKKFN